MPGIVGLVTRMPRKLAEARLHAMVKAMQSDPRYSSGTWIDEGSGAYIGWVERGEAFSDGTPLKNERGDLVLAFSGEEYPEPSIISQLTRRGHSVNGSGGPSYLVHVAEEDADFPRNLNGRFHGVLVDRTTSAATVFNDRYGMHRLFYHESQNALYFAAEPKAILAALPELRRVDPQSLGEYIACGCVLEDRTLFQGILALPAASAWTFRSGCLFKKGKYFDPAEWEQQESLGAEEYYRELKEVFSRNLPRYFDGRQKVAVSLTGGLDTRMIMAWHKAEPKSLPTYTFGGPYRDCQDVVIARNVASVCSQPHQIIPVDQKFLSRFADFAERTVYLSEGSAGVNRAADLYCNEIAAQIAPVRMTGNYGSEILRRLRVFKPSSGAKVLFDRELVEEMTRAEQTYRRIGQGHAVSFTAFRQAPWYQSGLLGLEQTQLTLRSPFLDNDLVRTAFRAPKAEIVKKDIFEDNRDCSRLIEDGNPALHAIPTDRGLGGSSGWRSRISRAFLEFTFRAEYAYDYGMPQKLARIDHRLSWLHLERLFLGRHKFCHYRVWYRDNLSSYVKDMLLDSRTLARPFLRPRTVEEIVMGHIKGNRNYTTEIHKLLTLELVHRLFLDSSRS
jgi:asparagine synthase (glutamine-hydrolysing)